MMKASGAANRVFDIIDRKPVMPPVVIRQDTEAGDADATPSRAIPASPPAVSFRDINFAYPLRADMPVLGPGFSLEICEGEVLALVGGSGSGKSTVAALLTRLYDVNDGGVFVGGRDIRDLEPRWLRESIGVVAQEPALFATSIAENIRYGCRTATDECIRKAARAANVLEFTDNFADGLDTFVGQRGTQLSGGQKQRVAVARCILKNPPVVIFDEATSALDAASEYHVQKAIETVMEGRTVISIAHRLSTVRGADRIAVLEGGRIVEVGAFDELVSRDGGAFRALMGRQLQQGSQ